MEMINSQLVPFCFGDHLVRVIEDEDGSPWFVAKDVAKALDYEWKGSATIGHVPEEWRGVYSVQTPSGVQDMLALSEQGLYFFLGRSDKPKALPFQKWIAGDVIPSIRKTGQYKLPRRKQKRLIPDTLPPEAENVPPRLRRSLWQQAIFTARLDNSGSEGAVAWFGYLCRLNGFERPLDGNSCIWAFMDDCLEPAKGHTTPFSKIQMLFEKWWLKNCRGSAPGVKTLSEYVAMRYSRAKASVSVFRDCRIRQGAAN